MTRTRTTALTATLLFVAAAVALTLVFLTGRSSGGNQVKLRLGASVGLTGKESEANAPGEGPAGGYEAYLSAQRTYPANTISPAIVARAKATFGRIAKRDVHLRASLRARNARSFLSDGPKWQLYGPRTYGIQPGVTSFSGATNVTASRTVALLADPKCNAHSCRVWAGASGGGVWRTNNILAPNPQWKQVGPQDLDQNSIGERELVLDPTDRHKDTIYLGTGEGNRCSSGCEAGVGIYKTTDGGNHWKKLADKCVSNATFTCATPGKDAFLGRAINAIVIDPNNAKHILVGSAQAVRGLSHTIGNGGTTRVEPGANEPGLYESFDGGQTFTEVWDGGKPDPGPQSFGINKVQLDPLNPSVVYVSAFDAGLWRRDAGAAQTAFTQLFKPQFVPPQCAPVAGFGTCAAAGIDRTMFALTTKNGHTRIYLTEGTQNTAPAGVPSSASPFAANFWRTDNGDQPAATLLASQGPGSAEPNAANVFPASYSGWQRLTSQSTASPFYASDDFCTGQCWYDQDVYTPAGMPDTVYLIGSFSYGELPCNTKGVGCGNGRSNGRAVLYSTTAGDPAPVTTSDQTNTLRTFSDLTYDAQNQPAPWCAYDGNELALGGVTPPFQCLWAPDGIHPDQHAVIINPGNPTQIFEASDGGIIRTSGTFADISSHCNSGERPLLGAASLENCKRLLSRVPVSLDHIDKKFSSTLQFINVAINPSASCEVMGGTQDNGTWSNNNGCDRGTFNQVIYGDGGNAVYDATNPTWRANEFTGGFGDSNFENGDPTKWVIATAPLVNSGEPFAFYWPQIGDPNPQPGTHPIYEGGLHVWRSWAFGAGTPGAIPQDTTPDIAFYEANCPEFTTPGSDPHCGDYQPLGPAGTNTAGDLTGTFYGPSTDRGGGSVSFMARDGADHGTMWAATSAGRIFVSHNVNASDPASVTWHRIDNSTSGSSPTRFPSGIYIDPADSGHAWVTYSGYNAVTPATPGHVFEVRENGTAAGSGVFTNLNVESGAAAFPTPFSDGDLPVSDVVRDDATHTLYVGTDFGVLRGSNDGHGGWHTMQGMPRYEIMHLEIQPSNRVPVCVGSNHCERVLYAATHSQGIWRLKLGGEH